MAATIRNDPRGRTKLICHWSDGNGSPPRHPLPVPAVVLPPVHPEIIALQRMITVPQRTTTAPQRMNTALQEMNDVRKKVPPRRIDETDTGIEAESVGRVVGKSLGKKTLELDIGTGIVIRRVCPLIVIPRRNSECHSAFGRKHVLYLKPKVDAGDCSPFRLQCNTYHH